MKKTLRIIAFAVLSALLVSCGVSRTVPITGRKQNLMVTDEQILELSSKQYAEYMQSAKKSSNATQTLMVQRVGSRLSTAVNNFLKENGLSSELDQYQWEFNLVEDQSINAFCMPGGKIVVYEGIMPVCGDETSLAIVVGHEIAHAVAKHSAEQISKKVQQAYGVQIFSGVLKIAGVSDSGTQLATLLAQTGFDFSNLSYSRKHENEADRMGLVFAAMAGYDPRVAVDFWKRMAAQSGSTSNFDAFSDHPADAKRIANIESCMDEALSYYKK